jgi:hypothetical protein
MALRSSHFKSNEVRVAQPQLGEALAHRVAESPGAELVDGETPAEHVRGL